MARGIIIFGSAGSFDLSVHINAPVDIRLGRINQREYERFGDRILKGGDLFEEHQRFLNSAASYDFDGSPCLKEHEVWVLPCKVIHINGEEDLSDNMERIIRAYKMCI